MRSDQTAGNGDSDGRDQMRVLPLGSYAGERKQVWYASKDGTGAPRSSWQKGHYAGQRPSHADVRLR